MLPGRRMIQSLQGILDPGEKVRPFNKIFDQDAEESTYAYLYRLQKFLFLIPTELVERVGFMAQWARFGGEPFGEKEWREVHEAVEKIMKVIETELNRVIAFKLTKHSASNTVLLRAATLLDIPEDYDFTSRKTSRKTESKNAPVDTEMTGITELRSEKKREPKVDKSDSYKGQASDNAEKSDIVFHSGSEVESDNEYNEKQWNTIRKATNLPGDIHESPTQNEDSSTNRSVSGSISVGFKETETNSKRIDELNSKQKMSKKLKDRNIEKLTAKTMTNKESVPSKKTVENSNLKKEK
ncbi:hypothetical protein AB6A40_006838 [Gnathostoma spinigerum]|uniref:Uncharacterized protein n=1 Tax=Gnathostoma spinigerum TaxID=75299 RepID=A0ABD6EJJ2_9BILA